ncbi:MAG: gliding motility-associated C-terminal domain-containing protein [Chitinophagaceae bacterium]
MILICSIGKQSLYSQKIYNTWLFGYHGGMDFNTSPPTPVTNKVIEGKEPPYYTSTICDKTGKLLFFTDGIKVWNKTSQELPRIQGRWPWLDLDTVLPLVCPMPGNDSLYYLFTTGKGYSANAGKLLFTTINMAGNGNTGEIVYPQPSTINNYFTVLTNNTSTLLAGMAHCNGNDTWIVTISDGVIKSFLINTISVSTNPVISPLAIPQSALNSGHSNIKFSANGEKLIIPIISRNEILVYDFNNQTGLFSNPILLHLPPKELLTDIEISPAGSKLYYGSYENQMDGNEYTGVELHNIYQLNLEAGSPAEIEKSRYVMNSFPDRGGCPFRCYIIRRSLQLGPDGKIYISLRDLGGIPMDKTVNAIEFPEKDRGNASYRRNYLNVGNVYKFINVNYIRSGSFSTKENGISFKKKLCLRLPAEFSLFSTRIDSVKWDFGDPSSGVNNFSTSINPTHNYKSVGVYTIKAIVYKYCKTDTALTQISIDPDPIVRIPEYIKDTIICIGTKIKIDAAVSSATSYSWSDGLIYSYREISEPGDFRVQAFNACSQDQKSFSVGFEECPCEVFTPTAFTPDNDGLNDDFKPLVKCNAKDFQFKIFNRFGNLVFATTELNKGWDGKFKNIYSEMGVYIWMLQYRNPNNNQVLRKQGTVTLIR